MHWGVPQAFTEHYPVVHFAKWVLNMPVVTDMAIEAEHAYLPKYVLQHPAVRVHICIHVLIIAHENHLFDTSEPHSSD